MFYCDPCAEKNDYPQSISKSNGKCELCNKNVLCNDVHHSKLPVKESTDKDKAREFNEFAFPTEDSMGCRGMTLLDYNATEAMKVILKERYNATKDDCAVDYQGVAADAYDMAIEMIIQKSKLQ